MFEQIQQHRPIEFPTEGQAKEVAVAVLRIALVGEQPPHIDIGALGQGRPDHLIAEARDPHGVGAGERQHRPKGTLLRSSWLKQQGFLVQRSLGLSGVPGSFISPWVLVELLWMASCRW